MLQGMGICREKPQRYLGEGPDEFSFWFDDGDIYHAGLCHPLDFQGRV